MGFRRCQANRAHFSPRALGFLPVNFDDAGASQFMATVASSFMYSCSITDESNLMPHEVNVGNRYSSELARNIKRHFIGPRV